MGGDGQGDKPLVRFEVEDGIGVITIDNPPVNALGPGVRDGIIEAVEKGEADPNVKAMVLIGAGRSFIAGADIRQFGKPRPTPRRHHLRRARRQHEAGRRGDPRLCAGRRARERARLPLPHRRAERQGRPARGADRHPAGRRRHAAPAAPDRPEGGDGDDRLRPPRAGRRRRRSSASSTRSSPGKDLRGEAIAYAKQRRRQAAAAARARHDRQARRGEGRSRHVRGDAQVDRAQGPQPEGALPLHRLRRGGRAPSRSTRASRPSGGCSRSWRTPTRRRRCATPSSPSARSPRSRACRRTWSCRRSRRRPWSAPARWAAASP